MVFLQIYLCYYNWGDFGNDTFSTLNVYILIKQHVWVTNYAWMFACTSLRRSFVTYRICASNPFVHLYKTKQTTYFIMHYQDRMQNIQNILVSFLAKNLSI